MVVRASDRTIHRDRSGPAGSFWLGTCLGSRVHEDTCRSFCSFAGFGDMGFSQENVNTILRDKYFRNAERDHERRNRKDYRRRVRAYNAAQVKQEPT